MALACFEVDLPPVARYKAGCLRSSPELLAAVGGDANEKAAGELGLEQGLKDLGRGGSAALTPSVVFRDRRSSYALVAGDLGDTAVLEGACPAFTVCACTQ